MASPRRGRRAAGLPQRRAAAAPLVAVMLVVLVGFAALGVDVGHIYVARGEMQRAADASALAGASALLDGSGPVTSRAIAAGTANAIHQQPLDPAELDVVIGYWESRTRLFYPATGAEGFGPNAVQVTGLRPELSLFFARSMGFATSRIEKGAIAVYGGGRCAGLWGLQGVTVDGSIITDSYDAVAGAYDVGNIYANGDVCSCRDLTADGGIEIRGDAMYGMGYAFIPAGTSYSVWGAIGKHGCAPPAYVADFDEAALNNDNATMGLTTKGRDPFNGTQGDLYVTGNDSLTLAGGVYYLTSLMIDGQATITVTGQTTFFVTGFVNLGGGGIVNATGVPRNLVIFSQGDWVYIRGNSGFYGAVVAPDADIQVVGDSNIYGTLLGRTLDFDGNMIVHVDESLVEELFGIGGPAPVLVK